MTTTQDALASKREKEEGQERALRPRPFAKRYGMSDRLVYQLLREGRLPCVEVNGRYLILTRQFEEQGAKPQADNE